MANSNKVRKGNDLMIFIDGASVAFATNHTLTLTTETEDVQSKDSGYNGATMAKRIQWEIQSENLYIDAEYQKLLDYQLGRQYVDVVWGVAKVQTGTETPETGITATDEMASKTWIVDTGVTYYSGKALISSMTLNASAGENATYSVTLTGSGDFEKKTA